MPTLPKSLEEFSGNVLNRLSAFKEYLIHQDPAEVPEAIVNFPKKTRKIKTKKIKSRIIIFDENGNGIDRKVYEQEILQAEIDRLNEINVAIEISSKLARLHSFQEEIKRLSEIEIQTVPLLKELKEHIKRNEARLSLEKVKRYPIRNNIGKCLSRKNNKLFDVIFFIKNEINDYKLRELDLSYIDFPSFKASQAQLLTDFLNYIYYDNFKNLINFVNEALGFIDKTMDILEKLEVFSEQLGFPQHYCAPLKKYLNDIRATFSKENIIDFFENSLNLFLNHTLYADSYYKLYRIDLERYSKIDFPSYTGFLEGFILNNTPIHFLDRKTREIKGYLVKNQDNSLYGKLNLHKNSSLMKFLSFIFRKYIFNFFSTKHYFIDKNHKNNFLKKLNLTHRGTPTFIAVRDAVFNLGRWDFLLGGISPLHLFNEKFKECLSKKLFLNILNEEFEKILSDKALNDKRLNRIENTVYRDKIIHFFDRLCAIANGIKSLDKETSITNCLAQIQPNSRQEIIEQLNNSEEMKFFTEKIASLGNQLNLFISDFSNLLSSSKKQLQPPGYINYFFLKPQSSISKEVKHGPKNALSR